MTKTKNPLKLIKNYLGELMTIIGSGIFVYNVFNFNSFVETNKAGLSITDRYEAVGVAYYYSSNALLWLTISTMLIVIGILIIRSKPKRLRLDK